MKPFKWLLATYKYRKWLKSGVIGFLMIFAGMMLFVYNSQIAPVQFAIVLAITGAGLVLCFTCFRKIILALINFSKNGHMPLHNIRDIGKTIFQRTQLREGPRIAVIGGGTGISTLLRALKQYTSNISAIITVADDGGGSGMLRRDLGILPPGDIRNCILALADTEPQMEKLLQYRFTEGELKGQSFGNLFLAAMTGISNDFEDGVRNMSQVLAVTGTVLPVTSEDIQLVAELEDGTTIKGESRIGEHYTTRPGRIKRVFLDKANVKPLESALAAIDRASVIILGPGSLYTSIIPNLLVEGVVDRIVKSPAIKIYVANVMTQPGETEGYSVYDHIRAIYRHARAEGFIDYCIMNTGRVPDEIYKRYLKDGAAMVKTDTGKIKKLGIKTVERDLLQISKGYVRHDPVKLMNAVAEVCSYRKKSKEG